MGVTFAKRIFFGSGGGGGGGQIGVHDEYIDSQISNFYAFPGITRLELRSVECNYTLINRILLDTSRLLAYFQSGKVETQKGEITLV